ncbi:histidine kinase [Streptomyces sp. SCSIO 30461]|uniref:sensor histidine kinase n=1 Tax=Streptomyces sp. SCSIO 30461 TaxID=3118085 RepID=UPI0030D14334
MSSPIAVGWRWFAQPGQWSRRRIAGEVVLALILGLLVVGLGDLVGESAPELYGGACAAVVLSVLRRRLPVSVLVLTSGLSTVIDGFVPMMMMVVGWSAGRRIPGAGRALAAFTGAYLLGLGGTLLDGGWSRNHLPTLVLLTTLLFLATTVVPGLASRYWFQRRTLLQTLQDRNLQLLREREMVAWQARLRERQRIAQDMHDSLGHQLALIAVHTGALEVDRELTDRQREAVGVLREASVTAMHELREVVGILRDGVEASAPVADESGRVARGTAGIAELVESARAAGPGSAAGAGYAVELRRLGDVRPLAAAADHAAYRIVQEALTNAFKHAPGAPIAVELRYEPDSFVVEIVNAAAADTAQVVGEVVSGGQGLTGLHERARLVGGMVHAGPLDDGGFRVAGVLPYGVVEAAPIVGAMDDFRGQRPAVPPRNGVPVTDWTVSERELAMGGRIGGGRSRTGGVALGCGIAVAAVALLVVASLFGVFFLMGSLDKGMITPDEYDAVEVGMPEADVRGQLPDGDTFATVGLQGTGPKRPAGSSCFVLMSSETGESMESEPVFRFCFKDGKLVEKRAYEAKR